MNYRLCMTGEYEEDYLTILDVDYRDEEYKEIWESSVHSFDVIQEVYMKSFGLFRKMSMIVGNLGSSPISDTNQLYGYIQTVVVKPFLFCPISTLSVQMIFTGFKRKPQLYSKLSKIRFKL